MPTIAQIQERVAAHFGVSLSDLLGKRRHEFIVFPRQVGMYVARTLNCGTLVMVGRAFGDRDHGTVAHAIEAVQDRMDTDPVCAAAINCLVSQLRNKAPAPTRTPTSSDVIACCGIIRSLGETMSAVGFLEAHPVFELLRATSNLLKSDLALVLKAERGLNPLQIEDVIRSI